MNTFLYCCCTINVSNDCKNYIVICFITVVMTRHSNGGRMLAPLARFCLIWTFWRFANKRVEQKMCNDGWSHRKFSLVVF